MWSFVTRGDGIDGLRKTDSLTPSVGPTEMLVRMTAVALNYRDLLVIGGVSHWAPSKDRVPVSDGVGIVTEIGVAVTRFKVGDRVAGIFLPRWLDGELTEATYVSALGGPDEDGVLSEFRLFDEQSAVNIPTHLSNAEGATLPVAALTAWHAVRYRSAVQAGDTVLIQGTGGVSLFALQFVLALGGDPIVLSSSETKLDTVRALGVTQCVNYSNTPDWDDEVLKRTHNRGVDHVIEVVGGDNLNRSLRAIKVSGSISFIGLLAGLSAPINTYAFVTRNVRIHGIETGSRSMFEEMNEFVAAHGIRPTIDKEYRLSELPDALHRVESGGHIGKIVVNLGAA